MLFLYRAPEGLVSGGACGGSTAITEYNGAEDYVARVREAVAAGPVLLPTTGSGSPHHGAPIVPLAAASALAAIGLAANAAFALRRR